MLHRFLAWPIIFLAVIYFWNFGGLAVAFQSIQQPEAINGTLGDSTFSAFHEQAMRLAQRKSGKKGKKGGKKGKKSGDGAADESEGDRPDPEILKAFIPKKATTEAMDARGFFETGLRPVYPDGLDCQTGDAYVFTVRDTGVGMDDKELAKAMSKFGQVDSGLDRKHEGTGLGLPLTQGLVELHGGKLEIDSNKGEGTTVTVRFPPERTVIS